MEAFQVTKSETIYDPWLIPMDVDTMDFWLSTKLVVSILIVEISPNTSPEL